MAFPCLCLEPGRVPQEGSLHPVLVEQPRMGASTLVAPPAARLLLGLQVWQHHQHLPPVLPGIHGVLERRISRLWESDSRYVV